MCGICGKLNTDGKEIPRKLITKMNTALAHRGPDDDGIYLENSSISVALGHKRLSIIDLSPCGKQPMTNEDKTLWMVFNGEIYNHQKLRKELKSNGHQFTSKTDGEVILHLYEQEGIDCLKRLNGMFGLALWDTKNESLFLCRDRMGIKPLVYTWTGTSLLFASEIKSLLCDPAISKTIDPDALNLYLTFNYIPAPHTIFKNIKKLKPGHYLKLAKQKIEITPYWEIKGSSKIHNISVYKEQLRTTLESSVKMRLMSDVPLGAFLSGGIDSSIIVGLAARASSSAINTFSIGYNDMPLFNETPYAREVAQLHHTNHHEIMLNSCDILDVVSDLLNTFDEPFADSSAIPTFIVSRATKQHVTVALSGDGGDELFAGYRMYSGEHWYTKYKHLPHALRKYAIEPLLRTIPDSRDTRTLEYVRRVKKFILGAKDTFEDRFSSWNEIFSKDIRQSLLSQSHNDINFDLGKEILNTKLNSIKGCALNRMLYTDLTYSLPNDMLTKVDLMSMKNALEVRVPLLDHHVVELAAKIPGHMKLHKGNGKHILIETFKDILPPSLLTRPKQGFEIPISKWLKSDLKFLIEEHLGKEKITNQGIFDAETIQHLIHDHLTSRRDTSWHLWNLIVFQSWYTRMF